MIELFLSSGASPHALTSDGDTAIAATTVLVGHSALMWLFLLHHMLVLLAKGLEPDKFLVLYTLCQRLTLRSQLTQCVCVCTKSARASRPRYCTRSYSTM
jgi:hypothetical protein